MRALLSVYDKENIVDFAKELTSMGWEIISTGGTLKILQEAALPVKAVEEVTDSPEILSGRVKTLHPKIHGGILNRRNQADDQKEMKELDLKAIDMVVNNLYPFEEIMQKKNSSTSEKIENIDIGGPTMIRAAAKNYEDVFVVTDPKDYSEVIERLKNDAADRAFRQTLATKAFQLTAFYDALIAQSFAQENQLDNWPTHLTQAFRLDSPLRYGENPHQKAAYYVDPLAQDYTLNQRHGKQLSYNNYNDMKACLAIVHEFEEAVSVGIKHNNPSGVAIGHSPLEAYTKAYQADPISIFGGIIGFNREIDEETALKLSETFLEIILAPSFTQKALDVLTKKKNIRLIEYNYHKQTPKKKTIKETINGAIVQQEDTELISPDGINYVSERKPSEKEIEDLFFAWKVAKHINSNGMVVAKNGQTLGIGHGEVRRIWALEKALERSEIDLKNAVVASDGFFFADTIQKLKEYQIQAVIQPGGSIQDEKVIKAANEADLSVLFTGMRHFKH